VAGLVAFSAVSFGVLAASFGLVVSAGQRVIAGETRSLTIPAQPERTTIYAADGSVLATVYREFDRQVVPLKRIRPITRKAVLAVEDARFYQHGPIDLRAIARAALANLSSGSVVQGGSTITQQLVKNTITGNADTLSRKVHEALDAMRVESTYSKDQILHMYLSQIYLGNSAYGIEAGSEYYFGKQVQDLTLAQSALLAGMIQAPVDYDPTLHPTVSKHRRDYVLGRMRDLGWIGKHDFRHAVHSGLGLSGRMRDLATAGPNSFVTQYVMSRFLSDPAFGKTVRHRSRMLFQGGLRIYTTIDPSMEVAAQQTIHRRMSGKGLPQSALVSIVPQSGAVRAMAVGNWSYRTHQYNLATDPGGGRSAGSSFKAFTLAAALEEGISPNTVFEGSSPRTIPNCGGGETWTVHNAEPGSGSYPLWLATADSVNAVFAQLIDRVGPDRVATVAHRMGITTPLVPVCPLTLGTSPVSPFDMTSAYATLANGGVHCDAYVIQKVVDRTGRVVQRAQPQCRRAIPADVAAEETAMLVGVIRSGTGTAADIGRPAAGKTGTGDNYQDAWFVGYVPQLATGVWVGYAEGEIPMPNVPGYGAGFGGVLAAPIWHDFMLFATRRMQPRSFPPAPIPFGGSVPSPPTSTSPSPTTTPPTPSPTPTGQAMETGRETAPECPCRPADEVARRASRFPGSAGVQSDLPRGGEIL
jgi:membrane peptidoglycan carboxypeptidase